MGAAGWESCNTKQRLLYTNYKQPVHVCIKMLFSGNKIRKAPEIQTDATVFQALITENEHFKSTDYYLSESNFRSHFMLRCLLHFLQQHFLRHPEA